MTSEEMERAIEFLLKSQATFEARLEETNKQIAQTNHIVLLLAETQNEFTEAVSRFMETQNRINARTDERVNVLVSTVERLISEGRNGKP